MCLATQCIKATLELLASELVVIAAGESLITTAYLCMVLEGGKKFAHKEPITGHHEKALHPFFLLLALHTLQLLDIVDLRLNGHVHFVNAVVSPASVLLIVVLILAHVAATHLSILSN